MDFRKYLLFILFMSLAASSLFSDTRTDNIDVYLVLDKSLSMEEELSSVKSFISGDIINNLLIPGDYLIIIAFYGDADLYLSFQVKDEIDKDLILNQIDKIYADGIYTDIGNALDLLKETVDISSPRGRRQYMLLITDGIQEAPPESPYYAPDGTFNHEFLENTKIIQKEGWKIQILGIGTDTAAKEIAEELSGTYAEIDTEQAVSEQEEVIEKVTESFLGIVEITDEPEVSAVGRNSRSNLTFSILSSNYEDDRDILISKVLLTLSGSEQLIASDVRFSISPDKEMKVKIPLSISLPEDFSSSEGDISLVFSGDTPIVPAAFTVQLDEKSWIAEFFWIIIIIVAVIGVVVFLLSTGVFSGKHDDEQKKKPVELDF